MNIKKIEYRPSLFKLQWFLTILFLLQLPQQKINAQKNNFEGGWKNNWFTGIKAGSLWAISDLPSWGGNNISPQTALSIFLGKDIRPWFSLKGEILGGKLSGQDDIYNFETKLLGYQLQGILNLFELMNPDNENRKWGAHVFLGLGFLDFESDSYLTESGENLARFGHGFGKGINGWTREFFIPAGIEITYRLNTRFRLHLETSTHFVNGDELDATAGGKSNDVMLFAGLGLSYHFNLGRKELPPLLNYSASTEHIPLKYKDIQFSQKISRLLKDGAKPLISLSLPQKIGDQNFFDLIINVSNDGVEGVADIEIMIPQGFSFRTKNLQNADLVINDRVANIVLALPAADTTFLLKLEIASNIAPVGNYPVYLGYKITDRAGGTIGDKNVFYIQKDLLYSEKEAKTPIFLPEVEFRIQLASSAGVPIPSDKLRRLFPLDTEIQEDVENGFYQYTVGSFKTLAEAETYKQKLSKELGMDDLFVVFFQNGNRVSSIKDLISKEKEKRYSSQVAPVQKPLVTSAPKADEFRIVFRTDKNRLPLFEIRSVFETPEPISEVYFNGQYMYFAGSFKNEEVATAYKEYLVDRYGLVNSKVIRFQKGQPMVE